MVHLYHQHILWAIVVSVACSLMLPTPHLVGWHEPVSRNPRLLTLLSFRLSDTSVWMDQALFASARRAHAGDAVLPSAFKSVVWEIIKWFEK